MLGFPASTEFGKRIPKQKFYENLDVSPALRRVFVDQIRLVYWRNKLAASTLNIAAGEAVTEIEVFEVRLNDPQLDEAVLKQIDKEIPYHMTITATRKQRPSSARASESARKSWRHSRHCSAAFRRTSCGRRCALLTGWITGMKRTASRTSVPRRSPATKTASACTSSRSWARFR